MFLRGKNLCKKKIFSVWFFPCLLLSVLLSLSLGSYANAISVTPDYYNIWYSIFQDPNNQAIHTHVSRNSVFNPQKIRFYEFVVDSVNFSGNYANLHFETNFVMSQPTGYAWAGEFTHTDQFYIGYCGSNGSNFSVRSSNVSTAITTWHGATPSTTNGDNKTLTIYGDVVFTSYNTGTHDFYCGLGVDESSYFYHTLSGNLTPGVYIEQQPTSLTFTTDYSEALQRQQNQILTNIDSSINNLSETIENQESDYDKEKADLDDKEDEVNEDLDDLSLSTPITSNPFSSLFDLDSTWDSCPQFPYLSALFNMPTFSVCSPYPSSIRPIITIISNIIVIGLVIRLYYKHLKGGLNG